MDIISRGGARKDRRLRTGSWPCLALFLGALSGLPGQISEATVKASSFAILSAVPKRTFTPNGDGVFDTFKICYDNPSDSVISLAKIFDLTGAEVAEFSRGSSANLPCPDYLAWDGRGRQGKVAPSGIYLYKIGVEQKVFTGSVVLAR